MADDTIKQSLDEFSKTTKDLSRTINNLSTENGTLIRELGGFVAKDFEGITGSIKAGFQQIPGINTLQGLGETLTSKLFSAVKQKREEALLRKRLGLTKEQFAQLKEQKRVNDSLSSEREALKSATENLLGFDVDQFNIAVGKFVNENEDEIDLNAEIAQSSAEQIETLRSLGDERIRAMQRSGEINAVQMDELLEQNNLQYDALIGNPEAQALLQAQQEEQTSVLQGMWNALSTPSKASPEEINERRVQSENMLTTLKEGFTGLSESFKDGLKSLAENIKEKGLMGLGLIAGLIVAPVVALVSFFTELGNQIKILNGLTGGRLGNFFAPMVNFFKSIGTAFRNLDFVQDIARFVTSGIARIKSFFTPLMSAFRAFDAAGDAVGMFSRVVGFASKIGTVFGKIFLPIQVIMSVFDFVSGFMDGYSEDGIIGGLREGLVSVFDGLIGAPIRLLSGAVEWILGAFGLDQLGAGLTEGVNQVLDGLMGGFRGIFDVIQGIFTFDLDMIGEGLGAIFSGMTDVLLSPFQLVYGLIQDIFSIAGIELPDFNLSEWFTEWFGGIVDFVKEKLAMLNPLSWFDGDGDEEMKLTPEQQETKERQERIAELEEDLEGRYLTTSGRRADEEELARLKEEQAASSTASAEPSESTPTTSPSDIEETTPPASGEQSESKQEPTVRVMTKEGFKDLTAGEIKRGMDDRSIKRSLAKDALRKLETQEKVKQSQSTPTTSPSDIQGTGQTEDRDLGVGQEGDSRSLANARNRYRVFSSEPGFEGEAEAARLKVIELEKKERVDSASRLMTGERTPTVPASQLESQPNVVPELTLSTQSVEMKTERTGQLVQTSNENAMASRTGMQSQQPVVVSAPQTNVSNTSNNTTTTTSVVNGDLAFRKVSTYDF